MSFFFVILLPTSTTLILVARLVESHLFFHCFFFLSFLALSKNLESWVEVDIEAL